MKRILNILVLTSLTLFLHQSAAKAVSAALLGWNNLGMHCMDSSFSEFSILPPYNTIEAQLIVGGKLVKSGGAYHLTYEAVADPDGSINRTSIGKGNWNEFESIIYGVPLSFTADTGLAGWNMPGPLNAPQGMLFETMNNPAPGVSTLANWFRAEGIPITPYDDAGNKNPYPMMRIVARDAFNNEVAHADIVTPVSDEMDCRLCHGAGTHPNAVPSGGWITDPKKDREYRLNILKLHDDREFAAHPALYAEALAAKGLSPNGLYATTLSGRPTLCAICHSSEALGTPSFASSHGNGTVPPLTASVHGKHAAVIDPILTDPAGHPITLNDSANRAACYRCHPGSATRCLRGTMGSAVAPDGSMTMQCQSCHGDMSRVGASFRVGWFMEPNCQGCHTGTATKNSGQIRFTSVFDAAGEERVPADRTFATSADTPAPGLSLYRFSIGHGGLQCSACHGSTHAEFPASHRNDNIESIQLQGHAGMMVECLACHTTMPTTITGGPHGLHPIGQGWVDTHHDAVSQAGLATCRTCHGADDRGTELSRVQGNRTFKVGDAGNLSFYRGATIGCYTCHQGPSSSSMNWSSSPSIGDVSGQTSVGTPVSMAIPNLASGVSVRILSQPQNGTAGIANGIVTYFPFDGFVGTDTFTFAAYDGTKNSVLATGTVVVSSEQNPQFPIITTDPVDQTVIAGSAATFTVTAEGTEPLAYQWYKDAAVVAGATSASLTISPVSASDTGTYSVVVSNAAGSATSAGAQLTVIVPPTITQNPVSQSVIAGGSATFTVSASGTTPLSFQWYKGLAPILGATASSFTMSPVATSDAGTYSVVVSNPAGSDTSSGAQLTVLTPPPSISGFSPASGQVGTTVSIVGANFIGATSVKFNGVPAVFTVNSPTSIATTVPSGATTGKITVTTPGGTASSASKFTVRKKN